MTIGFDLVSESILEKPDIIKYTLPDRQITKEVAKPQTAWERVLRMKPEVETITETVTGEQGEIKLYPLRLGTLIECSTILNRVQKEQVDKADSLNDITELIEKHGEDMIKLVCLAWWNKTPSEYPPEYETVIRTMFTAEHLYRTIALVIGKMGAAHFLNTTIITQIMGLRSKS